jgi:hypothetical protein
MAVLQRSGLIVSATVSAFRDEFGGFGRDIQMARDSMRTWARNKIYLMPVTRNPRIARANAILGCTFAGPLAVLCGAATVGSALNDSVSLPMIFGAFTVTCLGIAAFTIRDAVVSRRNHEIRVQNAALFSSLMPTATDQVC